jgi:hypothetical protein
MRRNDHVGTAAALLDANRAGLRARCDELSHQCDTLARQLQLEQRQRLQMENRLEHRAKERHQELARERAVVDAKRESQIPLASLATSVMREPSNTSVTNREYVLMQQLQDSERDRTSLTERLNTAQGKVEDAIAELNATKADVRALRNNLAAATQNPSLSLIGGAPLISTSVKKSSAPVIIPANAGTGSNTSTTGMDDSITSDNVAVRGRVRLTSNDGTINNNTTKTNGNDTMSQVATAAAVAAVTGMLAVQQQQQQQRNQSPPARLGISTSKPSPPARSPRRIMGAVARPPAQPSPSATAALASGSVNAFPSSTDSPPQSPRQSTTTTLASFTGDDTAEKGSSRWHLEVSDAGREAIRSARRSALDRVRATLRELESQTAPLSIADQHRLKEAQDSFTVLLMLERRDEQRQQQKHQRPSMSPEQLVHVSRLAVSPQRQHQHSTSSQQSLHVPITDTRPRPRIIDGDELYDNDNDNGNNDINDEVHHRNPSLDTRQRIDILPDIADDTNDDESEVARIVAEHAGMYPLS